MASLKRRSTVRFRESAASLPNFELGKSKTHTLQTRCSVVLGSLWFSILSFFFMLVALFLPNVWIIADWDYVDVLDGILLSLFIFFIFETCLRLAVERKAYLFNVYFVIDCLSILSLIVVISFFEGELNSSFSTGKRGLANLFVSRIARYSSVVMKFGRNFGHKGIAHVIPGFKVSTDSRGAVETKIFSEKVYEGVSRRISTIIVLVSLVIPLFFSWGFADDDYSMKLFAEDFATILDESAGGARDTEFNDLVSKMNSFYEGMDYFPYKIETSDGSYTVSISESPLTRNSREITSGKFQGYWNFTKVSQFRAKMDIGRKVTILFFVVLGSFIVGKILGALVLYRFDKLFAFVLAYNSGRNYEGDEAEMIEACVERFALVSEAALSHRPLQETNVKDISMTDRAVIDLIVDEPLVDSSRIFDEDTRRTSRDRSAFRKMSMVAVNPELVDTWDFDPLDQSREATYEILEFIFFRSFDFSNLVSNVNFRKFTESIANQYKANPFHSWEHGVDVGHCVFRLFRSDFYGQELHASVYTQNEVYGLLLAAIAHDVGHPGVTNQFLTETSDELAMKFNDRSPLENFHCSVFFQTAAECGMFASFSESDRKETRRLLIEAILHTDNAFHFQMVKDMEFLSLDIEGLEESQKVETLRSRKFLISNVILHASDISNQAKPWHVCQRWANRVLEEFFNQGDREKQLGIPIGILNDREKCDIPLSQIGFIEFIVAPLFAVSVSVFPGMDDMTGNLVKNSNEWYQLWISSPRTSDQIIAARKRVLKVLNLFPENSQPFIAQYS
jgi:3'5'-cyclic nucleotide phosphodiesterase